MKRREQSEADFVIEGSAKVSTCVIGIEWMHLKSAKSKSCFKDANRYKDPNLNLSLSVPSFIQYLAIQYARCIIYIKYQPVTYYIYFRLY